MKHRCASALDVSRETADRLAVFAALLLKWNRTINLISRQDETTLWHRHIADSLALIPHLPRNVPRATDLGSGGGFPGLVIAIAQDIPFDLVEADHRKATFLREAARATSAPVTVHANRAETVALAPAQLVTARAAAPLPVLLSWAERLLAPGGCCVFPKGRGVADELTLAAARWHMRVEQWPSPTDPTARILRLSEIHRV